MLIYPFSPSFLSFSGIVAHFVLYLLTATLFLGGFQSGGELIHFLYCHKRSHTMKMAFIKYLSRIPDIKQWV